MPGFTAWAPGSLTVSEGLAVFPAAFQLAVAGNVTVSGLGGIELSNGTFTAAGDLRIDNDGLWWTASRYILARSRFYAGIDSVFRVDGSMELDEGNLHLFGLGTNALVWSVGGDLIATNDALLYLYAAATNGATAYGALFTVTGNLLLGGGALGSWIYPVSDPTNGGAPMLQVRNLSIIATNSGFDATSRGFYGGTNYENGWGPGGGKFSIETGGGGTGNTSLGGGTYGSSNAPSLPKGVVTMK